MHALRNALLIALALLSLGQTRTEIHSYRGARTRMAATVHTWTNGIGDGDWNNVGNWNTAAVPGSGGLNVDTALFDGTVTQTGASVNLDRSLDNALYRVIIRPNFPGDIGGSGNPLIHTVNSGVDGNSRIIDRGTGSFYFKNMGNAASEIIMDGNGSMYLDTDATGTQGQIVRLFIKAGTVTAASTCSLQQFVVLDGPGAVLTVEAKDGTEDDPDFIVINAGLFTNNRVITADGRAVVFGGKLDQRGLVADLAMLMAGPAGRLTYTPNGTLGAAHNPDIIIVGLLDTRASNQDIVPARFVITQLGNVLGTAVQAGSQTYVDIDLREEYP